MNKKKIYAKQMPNEYYDSRDYYGREDARSDDVWIGGNKYFKELNSDLKDEVLDSIETAYYNFLDDSSNVEKEIRKNFVKNYKYELTKEEVLKIEKCCNDYISNKRNENEIVCDILTIIKNEEFVCKEIRGTLQDEWQNIIYPKKIEDYIYYIEAVYFDTGYEYEVSIEPCTREEFENEEVETDRLYVAEWNDDAIKECIRSYYDIPKENDIALLSLKNYFAKPVYEYEEK